MITVIARDIGTPALLSPRATFRYHDYTGAVTFFVTWFQWRNMSLLRRSYDAGIQVAFQYY